MKPKASARQDDSIKLSKKGKIMIEEALDAEKHGDVIGSFSDIEKALKALKES